MKIISAILTKEYIFTQKELKEKLGIEENIDNFELWEGLSPEKEEKGKSPDSVKWLIKTSNDVRKTKKEVQKR